MIHSHVSAEEDMSENEPILHLWKVHSSNLYGEFTADVSIFIFFGGCKTDHMQFLLTLALPFLRKFSLTSLACALGLSEGPPSNATYESDLICFTFKPRQDPQGDL